MPNNGFKKKINLKLYNHLNQEVTSYLVHKNYSTAEVEVTCLHKFKSPICVGLNLNATYGRDNAVE